MTVWWIATRILADSLAMTENQRAMTKDLPTPKPPPQREGAFKKPNALTLREGASREAKSLRHNFIIWGVLKSQTKLVCHT